MTGVAEDDLVVLGTGIGDYRRPLGSVVAVRVFGASASKRLLAADGAAEATEGALTPTGRPRGADGAASTRRFCWEPMLRVPLRSLEPLRWLSAGVDVLMASTKHPSSSAQLLLAAGGSTNMARSAGRATGTGVAVTRVRAGGNIFAAWWFERAASRYDDPPGGRGGAGGAIGSRSIGFQMRGNAQPRKSRNKTTKGTMNEGNDVERHKLLSEGCREWSGDRDRQRSIYDRDKDHISLVRVQGQRTHSKAKKVRFSTHTPRR